MNIISDSVRFLNTYKEEVKNGIGIFTFLSGFFGIQGLYEEVADLHAHLSGRVQNGNTEPTWGQTASKVILVMAKISIVLNAMTSRPGQFLIGWVATKCIGEEQLLRLFGPNLNFATTPYHPRHVVSIAAFILGLPATLKSVYDATQWVSRKICQYQAEERSWTDMKIELINFFETLSHRTFIHGANYALRGWR